MRSFLGLAVAIVAMIAIVANPAGAAGSAHFIKSATDASLNGSNLVCSFKEAGLASGSVDNVSCRFTETIVYECVNGGGKNPSASNKRSFTVNSSVSGTFTADKNGNLVGGLTAAPLSAAQVGFSCPPGQTVTLVSVSYSNVSIVDTTSGASMAISGTFA